VHGDEGAMTAEIEKKSEKPCQVLFEFSLLNSYNSFSLLLEIHPLG
jgi:hypothetical protein